MYITSFSDKCRFHEGFTDWALGYGKDGHLCYSGGECVEDKDFCNGHNDCGDKSDESFCDSKHIINLA